VCPPHRAWLTTRAGRSPQRKRSGPSRRSSFIAMSTRGPVLTSRVTELPIVPNCTMPVASSRSPKMVKTVEPNADQQILRVQRVQSVPRAVPSERPARCPRGPAGGPLAAAGVLMVLRYLYGVTPESGYRVRRVIAPDHARTPAEGFADLTGAGRCRPGVPRVPDLRWTHAIPVVQPQARERTLRSSVTS
jgi:hypothetical protein